MINSHLSLTDGRRTHKNILLAKVVSDAGVASVDYRENPYRTALDSNLLPIAQLNARQA